MINRKKFAMCMVLTAIAIIGSFALVSCGKEERETVTVNGKFYTVQDAWEEKLIKLKDCNAIEAKLDVPGKDVLDEETAKKITDDYYAVNALVGDDFEITYYGEYNGCFVVYIQDVYYDYSEITVRRLDKTIKQKISVGYIGYGYEWCQFPWIFNRLLVWREYDKPTDVEKPQKLAGALLPVKQAYERGYLDRTELEWAAAANIDRQMSIDQSTYDEIARFINSRFLIVKPIQNKCIRNYYGITDRNCILLEPYVIGDDPYGGEYSNFDYTIEDVQFHDFEAYRCVWVPIELILREE